MNIFLTDYDLNVVAQHHCDVHLRKMIVELAQMLSTAHCVLDNKVVAYKKTHANHPSAAWVRETKVNYEYAFRLLSCMCIEYEYRFDKPIKTAMHLKALSTPPKNITKQHLTKFALAMPEQFFHENPTVAYRRFMRNKLLGWKRGKKVMINYTRRKPPTFLQYLYEDVPVPTGIHTKRRLAINTTVRKVSTDRHVLHSTSRQSVRLQKGA